MSEEEKIAAAKAEAESEGDELSQKIVSLEKQNLTKINLKTDEQTLEIQENRKFIEKELVRIETNTSSLGK